MTPAAAAKTSASFLLHTRSACEQVCGLRPLAINAKTPMDPAAHRESGSQWSLLCRIAIAAILILLFPLSLLGALILCVFRKVRAAPLAVGIFSRSPEENYKWLTEELRSENFRDSVKEIRAVCIFNNGARQFRAEVEKCDFAILYHTKTRGRLNITNVEDAIYSHELSYLSDKLGRGKVIVVVDDLDISGEEEKLRILRHQPDIRERAQDLFLFTTADKRNPHLLERKLHEMKRVMSSGSISMMNLCEDLNICGRSSSFQYEPLTY